MFVGIEQVRSVLDKKLNLKKIPLNMIELYNNVRLQLDGLFAKQMMDNVPLEFLARYKYYIQALDSRLEKAKLNISRDRQYLIEVESLEKKLTKAIDNKHKDKYTDSQIIQIRFMIYELWISWYLQNIKTIDKVSAKRITILINNIV